MFLLSRPSPSFRWTRCSTKANHVCWMTNWIPHHFLDTILDVFNHLIPGHTLFDPGISHISGCTTPQKRPCQDHAKSLTNHEMKVQDSVLPALCIYSHQPALFGPLDFLCHYFFSKRGVLPGFMRKGKTRSCRSMMYGAVTPGRLVLRKES